MNVGRLAKIISDVLFITGLVVAGLFLVFHFTGRKPLQAFIVSSGSMEPAIKTGSIVLVSPRSTYQAGDIVTFYSSSSKKETSTHRIIGIGGGVARTMGDANEQPDATLVPLERILGSVRLSIPFVGYLAAYAKTPQGFILLVIIPATIIIYEELKYFFLEIKKRVKKVDLPQTVQIPRVGVILPVFFAVLITLSISISFFIDHETSAGNMFVGSVTITPTPTTRDTATESAELILPEP